ncbi:ribonuclease H-like domain-containing protein [Tanacetum coccineum]
MVTRSQSGIVKLVDRLSLHTSSISLIPKSLLLALKDPHWCNAMYDEYNALVKNGTCILVLRPSNVNLVCSMWLFKHKFHADETLSRYKDRLVANGSSQQLGVDFIETFSPVVKPATIRMILSLVVSSPRYVDSRYPHHFCLLQRPLYGQKQAPRAWFQRFTASSPALLHQIIDSLHSEFDMTDLGELNYFRGISTVRHPTRLFLSQRKYALQLLMRAHMINCNPSRTPVDTESKLGPKGVPVQDPTLTSNLSLYARSAGATFCRSQTYLATRYCVFLCDNLLSRSAKRQHTLSRSSAEAKYRGVANVVAETAWLRNLLRELRSPLSTTTLVYCDNVSAIYMSANPVQHLQTKHIEIDIHFVRNMVTAGQVRVLHVPSHYQYADIFTKGLPSALFEEF